VYFELHLQMVGIGVSFVTRAPSELLYVQADGMLYQ
jgi:hypothetical protein